MVARRRQQEKVRTGPLPVAPKPVDYPESDGKPMGETPYHRDEVIRLIQTLQDAYADRDDVYVSGNMMLYYEEGNPRASVSPDVFVVFGIRKDLDRRVFKVWDEGAPAIVFEITSRKTRREDIVRKRDLDARMGAGEYVLYDPLGEYLRAPLQGFRLQDGAYVAMAGARDALLSDALDMRLVLEGTRLVLFDRRSSIRFLSPVERVAAEAERAAAAEVRAAAEARVAELEALLRQQRPQA